MHPYLGSGPYCYADSPAMLPGGHAPPPSVVDVLTGSPLGFELPGGRLPLFDPYGWDPEQGLDAAIRLLGWDCRRDGADDGETALARLREADERGSGRAGRVRADARGSRCGWARAG